MPELPEIETITKGISNLQNHYISEVIIRNGNLRYKIDQTIERQLVSKQITSINRRAKYIVIKLSQGYLIIHLGMSGSITLLDIKEKNELHKHDHVDIVFDNKVILRYNDPRRFGCLLYTDNCENHRVFASLGVEPLTNEFNASYLYQNLQNKKTSIKSLIMENSIVVGVGNIYASEVLFIAKISPLREGHSISLKESEVLVNSIKHVLQEAIKQGGSSLRDYKHTDGTLGYFQHSHLVYNKAGRPCPICHTKILTKRVGQRSSFYCPNCQN